MNSPSKHPREPGANRVSLAEVGRVHDHLGAGGVRAIGRRIRRPIVNHDDVIDGAAKAVHHVAD